MSHSQSLRRWGPPVALAVILAVIVSLSWSRAFAARAPETGLEQLCVAYFQMTDTLRSDPRSQSERIRAASELADVAGRFPNLEQPDAVAVPESAPRIRAVLATRYATVDNLFHAARAVAVACGVDWRAREPVDPQVGG